MHLELARLLFNSIPAVTINFLAASVFLGEEVRKTWSKILMYGLAVGCLTFATFHLINISLPRIFVNLLIGLIFVKILFHYDWVYSVKLFVITWVFNFMADIAGVIVSVYGFGLQPSEIVNNKFIWVTIILPMYFIVLILSTLLRTKSQKIKYFFAKVKEYAEISQFRWLIIALLIQSVILFSFFIDYTMVRGLGSPFKTTLVIVAFFTLVSLNVFIVRKNIQLKEERLIKITRNAITDSIMDLINSVRSQRHDFVNILQIISSLHHTEDRKGLTKYLNQLTSEVSVYNDILKTDNPVIAAILNAKITQANIKGIDLSIEVSANLRPLIDRDFDITRILGNLIDNAIEAVEQFSGQEKWVRVIIQENRGLLSFTVVNPGQTDERLIDKLFEPGFTTKGDKHYGLGLYTCQQLARKLHGKIEFKPIPGFETSFSLIIPKP